MASKSRKEFSHRSAGRSLRPRCQQALFLPQALEENPPWPLLSQPRPSPAWSCISPVSACTVTWPLPWVHFCVSCPLLVRAPVIGFRAHINPGQSLLTLLDLHKPDFQVRSLSFQMDMDGRGTIQLTTAGWADLTHPIWTRTPLHSFCTSLFPLLSL